MGCGGGPGHGRGWDFKLRHYPAVIFVLSGQSCIVRYKMNRTIQNGLRNTKRVGRLPRRTRGTGLRFARLGGRPFGGLAVSPSSVEPPGGVSPHARGDPCRAGIPGGGPAGAAGIGQERQVVDQGQALRDKALRLAAAGFRRIGRRVAGPVRARTRPRTEHASAPSPGSCRRSRRGAAVPGPGAPYPTMGGSAPRRLGLAVAGALSPQGEGAGRPARVRRASSAPASPSHARLHPRRSTGWRPLAAAAPRSRSASRAGRPSSGHSVRIRKGCANDRK